MKFRITLVCMLMLAAPEQRSAQASEPTREQMEAAQTDGYGARRGKRKLDEEWLEPQRLREEFGKRTSAPSTAASSSTVRPSQSEGASSATSGAGTTHGAPSGGSGIVNGLGGPGPAAKAGRGHGHGPHGVVTGAGAAQGGGPGPGKGIVNASGGTPAAGAPAARSAGAGIVTAGGAAAVPSITGTARPGAGIVTGAGGPPGHANNKGRGGRH